MSKLLSFCIAASFTLMAASCSKNKDLRSAVIVDTGDLSYEGCGYLVKLDNAELLKPVHLPGAYQHDGIRVNVRYTFTGLKDTCQYGTVVYDLVTLDQIELQK